MAAHPKRYAMVVDSKKCINCKACVVACRAENSVPLDYSRPWMNEETRGVWPKLMASSHPEQCHQCAHPACVRVCPTGASYRRPDGIVVVNQDDCVGCRYCMIACPYNARFFRQDKGVVEKCDFCVQRLKRGQVPACVDTCPSKVRVFGDLNDPGSKLAELLSTREYRLKKPEAGTGPQIYYLI
jgi:tetrathionate reductase subunit B